MSRSIRKALCLVYATHCRLIGFQMFQSLSTDSLHNLFSFNMMYCFVVLSYSLMVQVLFNKCVT